MKIRAIYWVLSLLLLSFCQVQAASLATFTVKDPAFSENYKFYIDIYAVSQWDDFELGTSDLRIRYNDTVLSNPTLSLQNQDFNDNTRYDPMTVGLVGSDIFQLLIAPKGTIGNTLTNTEIRLARVTFDVNPATNDTETSAINPLEGTSTAKTAAGETVLLAFPGAIDISLVCIPSISGTPVTSVTAGDDYDFTPAVAGGCDPVSFEIQNKPSWASFDPTSGRLSGAPANADVGVYNNIAITAVDPDGDQDSLTAFDIEVTASCQAPTISGTPDLFVKANSSYSFTPTVSNGCPALSFSSANLPGWANLNDTTGALTGTPSSAEAGRYAGIDITVNDANGASDALPAFDIEVCSAAAITGTPPTSVAVGSAYSFIPGYSGCGDPTFEISNMPPWAGFDSVTGALSGTPGTSDTGTYPNIVISAVDETNDSATLTTFDIEVTTKSSTSGSGSGGGGGGCFIAILN